MPSFVRSTRAGGLALVAIIALVGCGDGRRADDDFDSSSAVAARPSADLAAVASGTADPTRTDDEPGVRDAAEALAAVGSVADTFDLADCPDAPRGAVADMAAQRYWLCADGRAITDEIPMTTASGTYGLPPVGTYAVFDRDAEAVGINGEALERFVAFYTTAKGNRIAFHEVVDQDPDTVGDLDQRGASAGCFRVREDDSIQVWNHLQIGDPVVVISN